MRLRVRFSLVLLALGLGPLVVVTMALVRVNLGQLETSAKEYRLAVADAAVRVARSNVAAATAELDVVGAALAQQGVEIDERIRVVRARLLGGQLVRSAALYGVDGRHVDTIANEDGPSPVPRPEVVSTDMRRRARNDGVALGGIQVEDGVAWLPLVTAAYRGPTRALYGYLWTAISLEAVAEELGRISQRRFSRSKERVFMVDSELRIVAHGLGERIGTDIRGRGLLGDVEGDLLAQDVGYSGEYEHASEPLLGVLVPIPDLGLGAVVEQPRAAAYATVRATWQLALAVGAGVALIAVALGLLLGRRLAAPIAALAAAASRIARGDFEARVGSSRGDEIGELGGAFDSMAEELSDYAARLVEETEVRANLARYVSPELVEGIVRKEIDLELGGQRRDVTVLFADVVAFTPLAEQHPPERIVGVLNELFTFLTEIVFAHGGVVDKFIGDCVMAVFGLPEPGEEDAVSALRAAEEMLDWLEAGNARWTRELGTELQLAIGVHTGPVVAGNIGSERRMEYTVIGDTVNVAARLEKIARPGQVLVSRATMEHGLREFDFEALGDHDLPGRTEPVSLFVLAP